jgi:iron(III) transport system substrate-binding protein
MTRMQPPKGLKLAVFAAIACVGAIAIAASSAAPTAQPASKAAWAKLVAKAKSEGTVTIYSTQIPGSLTAFAAAFKAKYGIDVTVNRQADPILLTQVNAEMATNKHLVDLWVNNSKPYVLGALKNGWVADAVGPDFFAKNFDRSKYAKPGKAFQPGAAALGIGWNTSLYPQGLSKFQDLTNPALQGKLAVLQPTSPAGYDYYLWMKSTYGADMPAKLAAQKPKTYISAAPMANALASGEIAASAFISATILDLKAQGAPIGFKLIGWNTPYFAMIMKSAPHPAAAQVLADYMVSPEGQAVINKNAIAALPKIPDTTHLPFRSTKLSDFTPQRITAMQDEWNKTFGK